MSHESKVILITGAGSAAGVASARRFAAAGHRVVLGDRCADQVTPLMAEIRAAGGSAECFAMDAACLDDLQEFLAFAMDVHKRVDVLINEADGAVSGNVAADPFCFHPSG